MTISELEEKYMGSCELCSTEELKLFHLLCSMLQYQKEKTKTIISTEIVCNCLNVSISEIPKDLKVIHPFMQHLELRIPKDNHIQCSSPFSSISIGDDIAVFYWNTIFIDLFKEID
uniref:Uncharacterized protein n=1 Tax=uncultured prokaryote TaxID=198431 RepID=A0A0H5QJK7_9ZZZZ|nr:hypothetical protein [uncultured prokaryote]